MKPLADRIRPKEIEDIVGQRHLIGENKILSRILKSGYITNMIFYGPPGVGKTTVANIVANKTNKKFYKINATNSSLEDVKKIIKDLDSLECINGILLYLDEIQNFNKKQQQSLLEFMENGKITLIASTTENPYHYIYKAILSRSTIFEFKSIQKRDIIQGIKRSISIIKKDLFDINIMFDENAIEYVASVSGGDLRRAINSVELCVYSTNPNENGEIVVDIEKAKECTQKNILNYDKSGDSHYDILSAFQKSIRGSDPDASIHYLARLIKAGDLISICRRLLVIASEDIGMAYPNAITIVKSCVDSANQLGFPEARIPLAQATLLLATYPKSNSAYIAIDKALYELDTIDVGQIPNHIKDAHYSGAKNLGRGVQYKYPHDYKNHYVQQQYLPDNIKDSIYYSPADNKMERNIESYLKFIREH
ncbi:replication-associated recombination protein A [Tepidibacter hydrothermalis]|uniref:Replication-associated recombination protein A n=1 Tax=Tepidibacter hydrothermalis TaxID=3036126 RepID=A0ABY8E7H2_9FIRM|nr:replication-associated recombination protein A [Tepidibacter hydrothermalis]WFD08837.1 replication-associated recombination protein A [Tepidibacter hydrothermalis]